MKMLYLQPNYSHYRGASYQRDLPEALNKLHTILAYGPGIPNYNPEHRIADVLALFTETPDLICYGAGWEWDGNDEAFDFQPSLNPVDCGIPTVMILNREYKKMEMKFDFIREKGILHIFTSHHFCASWQEKLGIPFTWFPFAADPAVFRDYGEPIQFDFGFSGNLHENYINIRARIRDKLQDKKFRHLHQFWGVAKNMQTGKAYARMINRARIWLSTPSAVDLVGPRFYEIMACGTLLFCPRSPVYMDLFKDGIDCVMFEPDLSDFDERLLYYSMHEEERAVIAERGKINALTCHTWDERARYFTQVTTALLNEEHSRSC